MSDSFENSKKYFAVFDFTNLKSISLRNYCSVHLFYQYLFDFYYSEQMDHLILLKLYPKSPKKRQKAFFDVVFRNVHLFELNILLSGCLSIMDFAMFKIPTMALPHFFMSVYSEQMFKFVNFGYSLSTFATFGSTGHRR